MQDRRHRADLDRKARAAGFPDYATMVAWHDKYRSPQTSNNLNQPISREHVRAATQWHPAMLLDWVRRKIDGAQQ